MSPSSRPRTPLVWSSLGRLDPAGLPPTVGLLRHPFAFSQEPLLDPQQFLRAAKKRGFTLSVGQLEVLHQKMLLVPLLARPTSTDVPALGDLPDHAPGLCPDESPLTDE